MRRAGALLVLILSAGASAAPPASPQRPAAPRPAAPATLSDLSWLAGRWVGEEKEALSEESWGGAAGDSMVGTWRLVSNGSTKLVELLTLLEEDGGVTLRLRHFDRHGVAKEEKDAPVVLPLVARGKGLAVFEGAERDGLVRLTYRREGKTLTVSLEKGREAAQTYRFRKAR